MLFRRFRRLLGVLQTACHRICSSAPPSKSCRSRTGRQTRLMVLPECRCHVDVMVAIWTMCHSWDSSARLSIVHTWLQGDFRVHSAFIPCQIVCASCLTLQRLFLGLITRFRPPLLSTCSTPLCRGQLILLKDLACF